MSTVTPLVVWAQRSSATEAEKNLLYVTIQVQDAVDIKLDLTATSLEFTSGSSDDNKKYHLKIDFFAEVDPDHSKRNTESGSHVYLVIRKKEKKEEYWPRLTKEKVKLHWIKTDFDKWVDEDEQDEEPENDDNDMANMANMMGGGAGGFGGPGGPGGFGGPGGAGGPGGMDFSQLMQGLGGAGGAGGPGGNFDISQLASQLGGAGGAGGPGGDFDFSKLASQLGGAGGEAEDAAEEEAEEKVEEVK